MCLPLDNHALQPFACALHLYGSANTDPPAPAQQDESLPDTGQGGRVSTGLGITEKEDKPDTTTQTRAQRARERQQQNKFDPGTGTADSRSKKSDQPTYIGDISKEDAKLLEMLAFCAGIPQIKNYSREDTRPDGEKPVCSVDLLASRSANPPFKYFARQVYEVLERSIPGFDQILTALSNTTGRISTPWGPLPNFLALTEGFCKPRYFSGQGTCPAGLLKWISK